MERFLKRYQDRIVGTIAGFDRILFRGSLRSLAYREGMDQFLSSQSVLYKDFGAYAEKITRGLKQHAEELALKAGRPMIYLASASESKEEVARGVMARDQIQAGLICVLSCVEPCQSYDIRRDREAQKLRLVTAQRKCLHLYFSYLDREFGLMHVRLQTWLPLTIQVCLNGREYLARQMAQAGIGYEQRDNCFTRIDDLEQAQALLDQLTEQKWRSVLGALARRVNPWLRQLHLRPYYWTVRQMEDATDVLFRDAAALAEIYPALVRHAIEQFGSQDVLRFLGRRTNVRFNGEVKSDLQRRVEGVRVKHWVEENSLKMYDKQGSVLRIETTMNNPRRFKVRRRATRQGRRVRAWLPLRKGVADLPRRVEIARGANARYLEALAVVGEEKPSHQLLDPVSQRVEDQGRSYRALRPISPQDSAVFRAILRGEFLLQGFRNRDLRQRLEAAAATDPVPCRKTANRITRLLRLLCVHGLIYKVARTSYYRITKKGHEIMTTALKFRESNIALLAT